MHASFYKCYKCNRFNMHNPNFCGKTLKQSVCYKCNTPYILVENGTTKPETFWEQCRFSSTTALMNTFAKRSTINISHRILTNIINYENDDD